MILTLGALVKKYPGQIDIADEAADRIYEISQTASRYAVGTMIARAQYLINSRRFERDPVELEALLTDLKDNHSLHADVWVTDAFFAVLTENPGRFTQSFKRAYLLPGGPAMLADYHMLPEPDG